MLKKPPKLKAGDKVAAISLSSSNVAKFIPRYEAGKKQAYETLGIHLQETPHALRDYKWLLDNARARAEDLMEAFSDPEIKAVFCITGGSDAILTCRFLDKKTISGNPKIFLGYSDATNIHFFLKTCGIVSFYGPTILTDFAENAGMFPYTEQGLRRTLFSSAPIGVIPQNRDGWTIEFLPWNDPANQEIRRKLTPPDGPLCLQGTGKVRGRLIGGCVESLEMLKATPYWPDIDGWNNAILFLETSELGMPPSYLTKCLRNYGVQGILDRISGIIYGRPGGENLKPEDYSGYDEALKRVVGVEFGRPDLPILSRMDFGHTAPICTLPYGLEAELDCVEKVISILENAVE